MGQQEFQPFEPVTLCPGENLEVSLTGGFSCEFGPARMEGLTSYATVPVRYLVAGVVPRTSEVYPGYTFGWTTSPVEVFATDVVRTLPPTSGPSDRNFCPQNS